MKLAKFSSRIGCIFHSRQIGTDYTETERGAVVAAATEVSAAICKDMEMEVPEISGSNDGKR